MKTISIKKSTLLVGLALLTAFTSTAFEGNKRCINQSAVKTTCTSKVDGLTQDQTSKIRDMEVAHRNTMEALRTERRSTTNEKSKAEIRIKMIDTRDGHRAEVKKLLTPQQQASYDALHLTGNHNFAKNPRGKGKNKSSSNGSCRNF
jgi:Skp family chaperone for outer membrane proteins